MLNGLNYIVLILIAMQLPIILNFYFFPLFSSHKFQLIFICSAPLLKHIIYDFEYTHFKY